VNPSEADEIRALLRFMESSEMEVSGRARVALSAEDEDLIRLLAEARLADEKKEGVMILLASNSLALETLAAILKSDPKEKVVSNAGDTSV
jgi:hypothetical protein